MISATGPDAGRLRPYGRTPRVGAPVLDLAICLILAVTIVGLLMLSF